MSDLSVFSNRLSLASFEDINDQLQAITVVLSILYSVPRERIYSSPNAFVKSFNDRYLATFDLSDNSYCFYFDNCYEDNLI